MSAIIAAVAANGVIGKDGVIPWRQSHDVRRFRDMVRGHPVIMGTRTYASHRVKFPQAVVVSATGRGDARSVVEALETAGPRAYVLGGERVFAEALRCVDCIYLTRVHAVVDGDTWFPDYDPSGWVVVADENYAADDDNEHAYSFVTLQRSVA